MEKCDKTIIKLIGKCDKCKAFECINCEISWNEVQEIKKLLDRVTELEQELEREKGYYNFIKDMVEKYHDLTHNFLEKDIAIIKKKDKIIDLMAERLVEAHEWFYSEFDNYSKEEFIEYFKRKVEDK